MSVGAPGGRHQSIAAWAKAHKPEAFLGIAGLAVGIFAYMRSKGSASSSTTTAGDGTLSPGVGPNGSPYGGGFEVLSGGGIASSGGGAPNTAAQHRNAVRRAHTTHVADVNRAHREIVSEREAARRRHGESVGPVPNYSASDPHDAMLTIDRLERDQHLTGSAGGAPTPVTTGR